MENVIPDKNFTKTLKTWVNEFSDKNDVLADSFISSKLQEELGTDALLVKNEILLGIATYEKNKSDIEKAVQSGQSKEEWLANKLNKSTSGLEKNEQIKVLASVHEKLSSCLGVETDIAEEVQEHFELERNMLAKSIGELATARVMQVFGEENSSTDNDYEEDYSEFIEQSLESSSDDDLKKIASTALVVLVKKGKIPLIPVATPVHAIVQIACLGIDHAKTIMRIAKKEISFTEGLGIIARDAVSAIFGIIGGSEGKIDGLELAQRIPVLGKPLQYISKVSDTVLGFVKGGELKKKIHAVKERIVPVAREFVHNFVHEAVSVVKNVASRIKNFLFG